MAAGEPEPALTMIQSACSNLKTLLVTSAKVEGTLGKMDNRFEAIEESLSTASKRVAPLQSLAMAAKALETRINRAISPALSLLDTFKLVESLQHKLLLISDRLSSEDIGRKPAKRLKYLLRYVECVDNLNSAINLISEEGEPVIQRLQEVVEFLSRTKATDQYTTHRLREALVTLKALYETEVDAMKFDGLLDEALLHLQDEYEALLQQIRHRIAEGGDDGDVDANDEDDQGGDDQIGRASDLGTEIEIEILRRISEILASTDCLDICIDIFVKVRYRRAAKALMRLNPDYLKTYTPEEIDEMEWETLETAISLWIQHFQLAVKTVFVSEKNLCNRTLGGLMDGVVWLECFVKIADKIMAVFFRFGEGVARSNKEPQKLFKLLDMFDSLEKLKTDFYDIFEDEAGADISTRFRELEKLLIHASSKVFWEFGLQIEGNSDGFPPPKDGSVPKLVRYAINYLKYLATEHYSVPMAKVLRTEQVWKAGILSKPETDENLLKDAITNITEALQRNVEGKRSRYKDKVLPHVFTMNTYWYIYMRTRNAELGKLLGDQYMKKKYKIVAEESAYMYQKYTWGPLVRLLEKEETRKSKNENDQGAMALARGKMEAFMKDLGEISQRHREGVYAIPEQDLREQIREATLKFVVPVYTEFWNAYSSALRGKSSISPKQMKETLSQIFDGGDRAGEGKSRRRDPRERSRGETSEAGEGDQVLINLRRSKSNTSDAWEPATED